MKIYTAVFRPWHSPYSWFGRDSGILTEGLRSIGVESRLVILDTPGMPQDERFLPITRNQFLDTSFWQSLALDAVVLQGGGEAVVEPVAEAIKASGAKVFFRMDSDGIIAPQVDPYLSTYGLWWWLAYHGKPFALLRALGTTALKYLSPGRLGPGRVTARLARADIVLVETLPAQARLQRLMYLAGRPDLAPKIHQVPTAVPTDRTYDPSVPKERLLIAVARWYDAQKDAPKLIKVLADVLHRHAEYRVVLIGDGDEVLRRLVSALQPSVADRINITGRLSHEAIPPYLQRARVFICSSRGEGFPNAVAESLCCGCSMAGPASIAAMHAFASHSSGSLARTRRTEDLVDAVCAEINAWESGQRDPVKISGYFKDSFSSENIARKIISLKQRIPDQHA